MKDEAGGINKGMVLQPGNLRLDASELGVSSIANFNTHEFMIIFHKQKSVTIEIPETESATDGPSPYAIFLRPIENLWNLQDGSESSLGEEEIEGLPAVGFKVQQERKEFSMDIVVWANSETGSPIRVEINLYNPENSSETMSMILDNFDLDAELDPSLFSMEVPEGYTLAHQNTLEETVGQAESTPEADKIEQSIKLWENGDEVKAVETLLSVDWTKPFEFSSEMYTFHLKEKEYTQLKQEDQQKAMQEIMNVSSLLIKFCRKIWEDAKTAVSNQEYEKAEKYLTTTLELGRLINREPEITLQVKMTGYGLQLKSLNEMINLYKESGEQDKLQEAQENHDKITAERESLIQSSI
jgi:hypothetical protein